MSVCVEPAHPVVKHTLQSRRAGKVLTKVVRTDDCHFKVTTSPFNMIFVDYLMKIYNFIAVWEELPHLHSGSHFFLIAAVIG